MLERLAARYKNSFPDAPRAWRKVGREAEHPLVTADGQAADLNALWPALARGEAFEVTREGALQTGLVGEAYAFSSEVGKGTVEIIVGPHDDLNGTCQAYETAMDRLLTATNEAGVRVLGYGIQPLTPPTHALMTPKLRYRVLEDVLGESWLWFALTASDQVHVEVSRGEMVDQCNLANLLSPVTIALCANSAIHGGKISPYLSSREGGMGTIRAQEHRHGMPAGPWADADSLVNELAELTFLINRSGAECTPMGMPFSAHLASLSADQFDQAWSDFLVHDHYLWHSARLRTAHATVELRSACQQPPSEHMAACALGVAMVAAGPALAQLMTARLGDEAWEAMAAWRPAILREGLAAAEPTPGLIGEVLELCSKALKARGKGEERFLTPLYGRLEDRQNPGQRSVKIFEAGGMDALMAALSFSSDRDRC